MKNIRLILIAFFSIVVFSSCRKNMVAISSNLTGQWRWEYSIGGFATQTIKPENNRIRLLNFYTDSLFSVTENGNASLNGTYHITTDTIYGKVILFNQDYFGDPNGEIFHIKNNELILTDYMISEAYTHYYKRIK